MQTNTKTYSKNLVVLIEETMQADMNYLKSELGTNWSFEVRKLVENRIRELKQVHALN
jgi:hypothetical protein